MVDIEVDQGLAVLTIDRPHARNAIALDTMEQLEKALDAAQGARALAITGPGDRAFATRPAGQIKRVINGISREEAVRAFTPTVG